MKKQRGFTLIELMIIVFVMGIVAGALIYNFKQGDRQRRVNLMRDTILSALRTAQNYSLSGKQIPPPSQAPFVRGNTRCGNDNAAQSYWVEFTTANTFDIMAEDRCGAIMRVQQFTGIQNTRFIVGNPFSLSTGGSPLTSNDIAIRFEPPFGSMTATGVAGGPLPTNFSSFVTATLTIEHIDGQKSRIITVDGISGRIE